LKADTVSNHLLIVYGASEHRKLERLINVNFPCNFTWRLQLCNFWSAQFLILDCTKWVRLHAKIMHGFHFRLGKTRDEARYIA